MIKKFQIPVKKKVNSVEKGKRNERAWAAEIIAAGFEDAYRSQQYCGTADSADVICKELDQYHFEVKSGGKIRLYHAVAQATHDCAGKRIPIVAHHRDRGEWLITLRASDWLKIEKERHDREGLEDQ